MTMTLTLPVIERAIELTTFADLTAVAVVSVAWTPAGPLAITFASDLTLDERVAVKIRCLTRDAASELTLTQAYAAYKANVTYLAIAVPTTAQAVTQVRALTNQMQGVIRFLAPLDG